MNWKTQIYKYGYIRTINESGKKRITRTSKSKSQDKIDICLNCTKKKCNGNCNKIRRKRNETECRNN